MINFEKIRWMNFLSTGNYFTEIELNKSKSTLIVGKNGQGKSTFLDALNYVLYGKPFRKINLPQMINTITGKNLLVEVEFSIGTRKYLIRRGMKPAIFEIYVNGKLLPQDSLNTDYQEYLTKNILKMNRKSFSQIVILGSASYRPFMQLVTQDRRVVVEDLLDIQVFSIMNVLLKLRLDENKSALKEIDRQLELIDNNISINQKHIKTLKSNNSEMIESKKENLLILEDRIKEISDNIKKYSDQLEQYTNESSDREEIIEKKKKYDEYGTKIINTKKSVKKELTFYHNNDSCPTCSQEIDIEFKNSRVEQKTKRLDEVEQAEERLSKEYEILNKRIDVLKDLSKKLKDISAKISYENTQLSINRNSHEILSKEILNLKNNTSHIDETKKDIDKLEKIRQDTSSEKYNIIEKKKILDVSHGLLKDGGIKTRIIKKYVPIINKLINKHLVALDFHINFELDENFKETIRSRHRDEFSYDSFSEGEKARIDLSLMLTWRALAKLRNSAATNLLIFDEVMDGSNDQTGVDMFYEILDGLKDTNIFVISHSERVIDKFEEVIKFEKIKNFSRIAKEG